LEISNQLENHNEFVILTGTVHSTRAASEPDLPDLERTDSARMTKTKKDKNMKIKLLMLIAITALTACQPANDKNPALLGQWQGTEWLIFDKPSGMDASQVVFEFKEDGTYSASFGNQNQNGTWRTEKDKLYTLETGKKEIMVKLLKADGTNLDFEMNRGGQKETLRLVKK
jgi:hypothetical protein